MVTENTNESDFSSFENVETTEPTETVVQDTPVQQEVPAPADDSPAPTADTTPVPQVESTPTVPNTDMAQVEQQLAEMKKQQAEMAHERQIRALEQEALDMERKLIDEGQAPAEARNQTMTHLQGKVKQIESEQKQKQQIEVAQAKRNASVHFAKKYSLSIDDLTDLERANDPTEMEAIAKTKSTIARQQKEIEELKRAQAQPQNFDSNSPTATAGINPDQKWIDAYEKGDRSPEATAAVKRLLS